MNCDLFGLESGNTGRKATRRQVIRGAAGVALGGALATMSRQQIALAQPPFPEVLAVPSLLPWEGLEDHRLVRAYVFPSYHAFNRYLKQEPPPYEGEQPLFVYYAHYGKTWKDGDAKYEKTAAVYFDVFATPEAAEARYQAAGYGALPACDGQGDACNVFTGTTSADAIQSGVPAATTYRLIRYGSVISALQISDFTGTQPTDAEAAEIYAATEGLLAEWQADRADMSLFLNIPMFGLQGKFPSRVEYRATVSNGEVYGKSSAEKKRLTALVPGAHCANSSWQGLPGAGDVFGVDVDWGVHHVGFETAGEASDYFGNVAQLFGDVAGQPVQALATSGGDVQAFGLEEGPTPKQVVTVVQNGEFIRTIEATITLPEGATDLDTGVWEALFGATVETLSGPWEQPTQDVM